MWIVGLIILFIGSWLFSNIHARLVFIGNGMKKHGKNAKGVMRSSYNRKQRYYKAHWNLWQRLCMIPMITQRVSDIYLAIIVLNIFHLILALVIVVCAIVFIQKELYYPNFATIIMIAFVALFCIEESIIFYASDESLTVKKRKK